MYKTFCRHGGVDAKASRLSKLGADITETLEVIPRRWKVIKHVREKFSCRDCETISQASAPFHVVRRGWAGPNLLAMIAFEKFGQHQPLNLLAKGKTDIARSWVYLRDDRPFAEQTPPAAVFYYSRDCGDAHPQGHLATYAGILWLMRSAATRSFTTLPDNRGRSWRPPAGQMHAGSSSSWPIWL